MKKLCSSVLNKKRKIPPEALCVILKEMLLLRRVSISKILVGYKIVYFLFNFRIKVISLKYFPVTQLKVYNSPASVLLKP